MQTLMESLGTGLQFSSEVVACLGLDSSIAFALADGQVAFETAPAQKVHSDGAILCATAFGESVLTGADDGRLMETQRSNGCTFQINGLTKLQHMDQRKSWLAVRVNHSG
jgi:hypothetical protein